MLIRPDLPLLTMEEATRHWLLPKQVLEVCALDVRDPLVRKQFDNLTSRADLGIPFAPRTIGKITTRKYSLESCVMFRALVEEVGRTRPAHIAAQIARAVADLLPAAMAFPTLAGFRFAEEPDAPWRVLLVDIPPGGSAVKTMAITAAEWTPANIMARDWWAVSSVFPHHLLLRCIETYGDLWAEQRDSEGQPGKRAMPLLSDPPEVCT